MPIGSQQCEKIKSLHPFISFVLTFLQVGRNIKITLSNQQVNTMAAAAVAASNLGTFSFHSVDNLKENNIFQPLLKDLTWFTDASWPILGKLTLKLTCNLS